MKIDFGDVFASGIGFLFKQLFLFLLAIWAGCTAGAIALIAGTPFRFEMTPTYIASLAYLAVFGSIIAFGAYLTLLGQIGADRAAYASLLFPLVALGISTLFEGYRWSPPALVGVSLVLAGNFLVLSRRRQMPLVSQAESQA